MKRRMQTTTDVCDLCKGDVLADNVIQIQDVCVSAQADRESTPCKLWALKMQKLYRLYCQR